MALRTKLISIVYVDNDAQESLSHAIWGTQWSDWYERQTEVLKKDKIQIRMELVESFMRSLSFAFRMVENMELNEEEKQE